MIEVAIILMVLGLTIIVSAFFINSDTVYPGIVIILIGGAFLMAGLLMIPTAESVTFCEEDMDGVYEYNDGLDTCTIQEGSGLVTYKLMDEEPYLSRFASQEKPE